MKDFAAATVTALCALVLGASANPLYAEYYNQERAVNASATATSTASSNASFPTDVGYPGKTKTGQTPFLAVEDRLPGSRGNSPYENRWNATDANKEQFDLFKSLGNLSPYHSSRLFPETTAHKVLPDTCTVEKAIILHRHGSRYPTSSTTEGAPYFGAVLTNWTKAGNLTASGPLSFLKNWSYELGAELLVPIGAQQTFDSGVYHALQYGKLVNESGSKPVVRTTSQQRILDSSRYFTLGMFGWDAPNKINLEVIIEADNFNNTLAPYDTCNNSNTIDVGDLYLRPEWDKKYLADAVQRLQPYTNLNLNAALVYGMQALCAYETVGLGYSNFCKLFTRKEWEGFEYDLDLQFQGDYGFMNPSGRAQGIGYAQELLDFLDESAYTGPTTTQNTTLNSNPAYYPVKQPLQVSFSHDDVIVSVLTALNYTQFADYLDPTNPDPKRNFVLSDIAPFAGRLVHEVIHCTYDNKRYVRTVLNEAIVPMDSAQGCKQKRPDGWCPLEEFVGFQRKNAVKAANFDKACFGKNGTDFTITGPSVRNGTVA